MSPQVSYTSTHLLKDILAIPTSSTPIINSAVGHKTAKVVLTATARGVSPETSPDCVSKKSSSPSRDHRTSPKKNKKRSPNPSPTTTPSPSSSYYASSAFMNSPDPLTIPIPNFDDVDDLFLPVSVSVSEPHLMSSLDKTSLLRQMLQVK